MDPSAYPCRLHAIIDRLDAAVDELRTVDAPPPAEATGREVTGGETLVVRAAAVLARRRLRARFLPADLFGEPGWMMLLALYVADRHGRTVNVKALLATADAPATTVQRWIGRCRRLGLVTHATDPADRRCTTVTLTDVGRAAIEAYLAAAATPADDR